MTREIRKESFGVFNPRTEEVIYEDGKRVGVIREETTGVFNTHTTRVEYDNDDNRVSETRTEQRGSRSVDVTRDNDGDVVSTTEHEQRGSRRVDVTRDNDGNTISESHIESRGVLHPKSVKVVRDTYQPKRTRSSSDDNDYSSYTPSSSYSSSSSSKSKNPGCLASTGIILAGLFAIGTIKSCIDSVYQSNTRQQTTINRVEPSKLEREVTQPKPQPAKSSENSGNLDLSFFNGVMERVNEKPNPQVYIQQPTPKRYPQQVYVQPPVQVYQPPVKTYTYTSPSAGIRIQVQVPNFTSNPQEQCTQQPPQQYTNQPKQKIWVYRAPGR